eukprot:54742-Prorocentrum_minimum.AAC.2
MSLLTCCGTGCGEHGGCRKSLKLFWTLLKTGCVSVCTCANHVKPAAEWTLKAPGWTLKAHHTWTLKAHAWMLEVYEWTLKAPEWTLEAHGRSRLNRRRKKS